jgi:DNA adenine methylase
MTSLGRQNPGGLSRVSMRNASPLRYPGGKGKLGPYLTEILELNGLLGSRYAEPFAGGAGVALDLLFSERVSHIYINDIDPAVFAFWYSAVHHTDRLISRIAETPVTIESWLAAREVKRNPMNSDRLELGFAAFFLNRTNQSGILNGGMIGGLEQAGTYKLDCRFNKSALISKIARIGFYSSRIHVSDRDAADFISSLNHVGDDCFVYIDPPYFVKGAYLYENNYSSRDHAILKSAIDGLTHRWVTSYDNADAIRDLYGNYVQEQFTIGYSARNHGLGQEVMIFSDGLEKPKQVYSSAKHKRQIEQEGAMVPAA